MKSVFCKRLAACLRIKRSPTPSPEPRLVMYRNVWSVDSNGNNDIVAASSETTELETMKKQLKEMRDILEARTCCGQSCGRVDREQQSDEAIKENEAKNDWMMAAAVLDRFCKLAVTSLFVVGTVVLFSLFFNHPSSAVSWPPSSSSSASPTSPPRSSTLLFRDPTG